MFNLLRLPIQFYSADTGGGSSGDQTPPEQTGGEQQTDNQQQQQTGTGDQTPPGDSKTFTQDDVNNLVARESKTAQEKLLKKLGIEDFDSAKDGLEKFRSLQDEQKTEAEKQSEALKALETERETFFNENQTLKAQLSATKAGVLADSVPDVVTLAKTMLSDEMDMDAAIAAVVEKYPHFAQAAQEETGDSKPKFSNGQHQTQPSSDADKWLAAFKQ